VSVWVAPEGLDAAVICLSRQLQPLPAQHEIFVREHRVLPVLTKNGVRADIVFAGVPKLIAGRSIQVASVEDMLLMKMLSEREKDLTDAKALLRRFGPLLDRAYLLPKLEELAEALSRPDILKLFHLNAG
jgi:hypothetical protein